MKGAQRGLHSFPTTSKHILLHSICWSMKLRAMLLQLCEEPDLFETWALLMFDDMMHHQDLCHCKAPASVQQAGLWRTREERVSPPNLCPIMCYCRCRTCETMSRYKQKMLMREFTCKYQNTEEGLLFVFCWLFIMWHGMKPQHKCRDLRLLINMSVSFNTVSIN